MAISAKTTLAATLLALIAPAPASAAEIRAQPTDVRRTQVAHLEWTGGPADEVSVEYRHGLEWVPQAQASSLLSQQEGEDVSSVRWRPDRQSTAGTYRIRVVTAGETLVSDEFDVRRCSCIIPGQVRSRWRGGRFRLSLKAQYASAGIGEFSLPWAPVQTGRPLVRVFRDGRRIGSVRLRYRRGAFRGKWSGSRGPRHSMVFQLVALTDGFGNR